MDGAAGAPLSSRMHGGLMRRLRAPHRVQKVLVVGASGATGRLVVERLLARGREVRAVVRDAERFTASRGEAPGLHVVEANLLDLDDAALAGLVDGCGAVVSCLGHNLTLKGIFGPPRRLVTDAVRRLCVAVHAARPAAPVRFVLMNTAGNRDKGEQVSSAQRAMVGTIRTLVPPHRDNEMAAAFLRDEIGTRDAAIEWVVVRPDTLVDEERVTEYEAHASPTRSAIFDPGKTSRINVADFMATLVSEDDAWARWKGRMPVLYNKDCA